MKINFFLRVRGFFVIIILSLSIAILALNFERNEFIYNILGTGSVVFNFFYIPIFIIFAIINFFRGNSHKPDVSQPDDHLIKYAFGLFIFSLSLYSIFYTPLTTEEKWAMERKRGAPMLSNKELIDNEIMSACWASLDINLANSCIANIKPNYSTYDLNMTDEEKVIASINDWCLEWSKLSYESKENCFEDQKERYGIID